MNPYDKVNFEEYLRNYPKSSWQLAKDAELSKLKAYLAWCKTNPWPWTYEKLDALASHIKAIGYLHKSSEGNSPDSYYFRSREYAEARVLKLMLQP